MNDQTFRTIGASVVLAGIAIAALMQVSSADPAAQVELAAPEPRTTQVLESEPSITETGETTAPFVYRVGVLSPISTDNFWAYYGAKPSVWNSYVLGPTKPALYSTDSTTGRLSLELAAAYVDPTWDARGWRVVVPLDDAMEWSDGSPVTAEDVAFTFQTVRSLGLGGSWADAYPASVTDIDAIDEHTLSVRFAARPNLSVWPHGLGLAPIMPAHIWSGVVDGTTAEDLYSATGGNDVSGGPLALMTWTDRVMVSRSNPGYPDGGSVDFVAYHVYDTDAELIAAISAGEIDTILNPKGVAQADLALLSEDVAQVTSPANGVRYLGFNLARAPMSEPAFRNALALLVDKEGIGASIKSAGSATWSMIPAANKLWFDEAGSDANAMRFAGTIEERLARALEALRGAGYAWSKEPSVVEGTLTAGEGLTIASLVPQPLTILTPGDEYDPARPDYVAAIADTLAVLGFDTRPVETDFDTVVDLAFTAGDDGALHYDMYMLGWTLGSPTLPAFYGPLFSADGAMNNTGYRSAEFEAALAEYEESYTAEEAVAAVWEMEQKIATDLPYLVLYNSQLTEVYRSDRVTFGVENGLGGLQGRLGGIEDVRPIDG